MLVFLALSLAIAGAGTVIGGSRDPLAKAGAAAICYSVLAWAWWLVIRRERRIRQIATELNVASREIAGAAVALASANEAMAHTVAGQSDAVSAVSGSSELMASIMRQSAESCRSAGSLMEDAGRLSGQVTTDLDAMVTTIREGSAAAARIAGVTRIVDDLAFQTNILALNAAVEAARAGESGAGFAVVADEVRSLAHRSAEAARDIANLAEESAAKTAEGNSKLDRVAGAMRSLIEHTGQIKALIDEMVVSTEELVHGTDQISESMRQFEAGVQSAAASSEETAATGQELSAQAAGLRELVGGLAGVSAKNR
jgi:methyl-accepting chemotaxis protein